jgi:hypothetical protein
MSATGTAQAVSPDYITFQVFVFINALGTAGVYPLAFIIGKFLDNTASVSDPIVNLQLSDLATDLQSQVFSIAIVYAEL